MEGIAGYASSDEDPDAAAPVMVMPRVDLAPQVDVSALTEFRGYVDPHKKTVDTNPTYEALSQPGAFLVSRCATRATRRRSLRVRRELPKLTDRCRAVDAAVQGPKNPFNRTGNLSKAQMNLANGNLEVAGVNAYSFEEQYHTFDTCGYSANPSTLADASTRTVGDLTAAAARNGSTVWGGKDKNRTKKRKVGEFFDPSTSVMDELTEEQKAWVADQEAKLADEKAEESKKKDAGEGVHETKTIFHGTELYDYQGRSFVDAPNDLPMPAEKSFLPKKCVHTWSGHTKGVTAIRFFPKTAHLLLSASQDNKVKIWNVNGDRKCMRTYIGHTKAVRDICFTNDGRKFLSCGFDRYCKLWDTETGQCIGSYTTKKIPYCCAFNPMDEAQNEFLVGQADKKIIQWAISDDKIVQVN
jgi:pre-mRNA-processing factor 17